MQNLKNIRAYVAGRGICRVDVAVENGRFSAISEPSSESGSDLPSGALLVPGFVDEHVHGAGGADAMDGTQEALGTIADRLAEEGTTSFLATTMTQSRENICNALSAVREYMNAGREAGAAIVGVHLEGPFISREYCGAQPPEYILAPSVADFCQFNEAAGGNIRIVTLAPEEAGADELIAYLKKHKIVASVGHTCAKFADVERAISLGACSVTHTYNAQRPLHHREAGVVGAAMLSDKLNCELICDTIHVCVPAMKLIVKNKPRRKVTLITDAMRAKGIADGVSELGGQTVYVKDGQARLADGTLAGSVLKMNVAVKNMVEKVGAPIEKALDFASFNPAKNLHMEKEIGSVAVGKRADYAVLNENFDVLCTVRNGKIIYKRR